MRAAVRKPRQRSSAGGHGHPLTPHHSNRYVSRMQAGSPPAVTLRLEVISGNATGLSITVEDELVIGRLASGDGRLEEDPELSRHHARISRERDGRYAIEDLGSSNGTFVNGLQLSSPAVLLVGDSVELGGTTLVVREIAEPEPPAPAPTEAPTTPDPFRDATVFARAVPEELAEAAAAAPQATEGPQVVAADPPPPAPAPPPAPPAPAPAAAAPPEAAPTPPGADAAPETPLPPFEVRVSIDAQRREAELRVGDTGEALRFVLDTDGWSFAGPAGD